MGSKKKSDVWMKILEVREIGETRYCKLGVGWREKYEILLKKTIDNITYRKIKMARGRVGSTVQKRKHRTE